MVSQTVLARLFVVRIDTREPLYYSYSSMVEHTPDKRATQVRLLVGVPLSRGNCSIQARVIRDCPFGVRTHTRIFGPLAPMIRAEISYISGYQFKSDMGLHFWPASSVWLEHPLGMGKVIGSSPMRASIFCNLR